MDIRMKDVKFGDCFIIKDNNKSLIVDCGSKNRGNNMNRQEFAFSKIQKYLNCEKKTDILITHFDLDHYNGFLPLLNTNMYDNSLETIYLSSCFWIDNCNTLQDKGVVYTMIYLDILSKDIENKHLVKLFNLILRMKTNKTKVIYLNDSMKFNFESHNFEVLWPPRNIEVDIRNYSKIEELNEQLRRIIYRYVGDLAQEKVELYVKTLNRVYRKLNSIQEFEQSSENENFNTLSESLNDSYKGIEELKQKVIINRKKFENYNKQELLVFKQSREAIIDGMNACSIVFHDTCHRALFLGDATPKVLKKLDLDGKFKDTYGCIKVQHHGTKSYFYENLPEAEKYLISNNGYSHWPIAANHIELYSKKMPTCNINCTNKRSINCDYPKNGKKNYVGEVYNNKLSIF